MAYRWKIPEVQANFVDPQATMQELNARRMQGYAPVDTWDSDRAAAQMQGYNQAPARLPRTVQTGNGGNYQFDPTGIDQYMADQESEAARQRELASLKAELADIEGKIQAIDARYPQLKNGSREWEIAAKRAEVGDMSAYDTMVNRGDAANGAVSGIENELYNAYKLLYGLNSKNDYEQGAYANQIETALRRADEWSARNPNAKMPPIYADLKAKYDEWKAGKTETGADGGVVVNNAQEAINKISTQVRNKTWDNRQQAAYQQYVDTHPNDDASKEIQAALDANRFNTVEARASAAAKKQAAEDFYNEIKDLPTTQIEDRLDSLYAQDKSAYKTFMTYYELKRDKQGKSYPVPKRK